MKKLSISITLGAIILACSLSMLSWITPNPERIARGEANFYDSVAVKNGEVIMLPEHFAAGKTIGKGNITYSLSQAGFSVGSAAVQWPRTSSRYGTPINVSTMTLDWICNQELFYFMEDMGVTYFTTPGGKVYNTNHSWKLPLQKNPPATNRRALQQYIFEFKGSCYENKSQTSFPIFDRYPKDQTEANAYLNTQYVFRDFFIVGNGKADSLNVGIRIGATTRSIFENGKVDKCNIGIQSEFMLEVSYRNLNFSSYRKYALSHTNGKWPGAGVGNSMGNMAWCENFRTYNSPGYEPQASLYLSNSHNFVGNLFTLEGDTGSTQLIFVEMTGGNGVNVLELSNIYMEAAKCKRAAIRIKAGKGQYIFNQIRSAADMPALVEAEGVSINGGWANLHVKINNSMASTIKGKLRAVGNSSYPVKWYVNDVAMPNNNALNTIENFDTSLPGSYLPKATDCRFTKPL